MMHRARVVLLFMCLSTVSGKAFAAVPQKTVQHTLVLSATIPTRIVDGDPLNVTVELRNASGSDLMIDQPQPYLNVRPVVQFLSAQQDPCLLHRRATASPKPASFVRLASRTSMQAVLDLAAEYPLGLRPGHYRLTVFFNASSVALQSEAAEFEIVEPNMDRKAYSQFRETCASVMRNKPSAADEVIRYASAYRAPYRASLLNAARLRAVGETRKKIDTVLIQDYPSQPAAANADIDLQRVERWDKEDNQRLLYERALKAELEKPQNELVVRDFRRLGTIQRPDDFASYERFVRSHQHSFFAPIVLQQMISAIEGGILPPGKEKTDADAVVKELYVQLIDGYPQSYFANRASANPKARRLLNLSAE